MERYCSQCRIHAHGVAGAATTGVDCRAAESAHNDIADCVHLQSKATCFGFYLGLMRTTKTLVSGRGLAQNQGNGWGDQTNRDESEETLFG